MCEKEKKNQNSITYHDQTLVIILLHSFNQHTKLNEPVRKLNIQKFVCEELCPLTRGPNQVCLSHVSI